MGRPLELGNDWATIHSPQFLALPAFEHRQDAPCVGSLSGAWGNVAAEGYGGGLVAKAAGDCVCGGSCFDGERAVEAAHRVGADGRHLGQLADPLDLFAGPVAPVVSEKRRVRELGFREAA